MHGTSQQLNVCQRTLAVLISQLHFRNVMHSVFFRPETRRASQKGNRCLNIPKMPALPPCHSWYIPRLVFTVW